MVNLISDLVGVFFPLVGVFFPLETANISDAIEEELGKIKHDQLD